MFCSIDFETRSTVDLRKSGVYVYAEHPDTEIWCMSYSFDGNDEVHTWVPGVDPRVERRLIDFVKQG